MVYLEFSISAALILFYILLKSNGISSQSQGSCSKTSGPHVQGVLFGLKLSGSDNSAPYHLDECDDKPLEIKSGRIIPLFHIRYTVMCDENHTLPLGGSALWQCRSAALAIHTKTVEIPDKHLRVSECTEKMLPTTIYVQRGVYVHNAVRCDKDVKAYIDDMKDLLYKAKKFLIQGLEFFLQLAAEQSECLISISSDSHVFVGWIAHLKFRLVHKPKYQRLGDSVFSEVNCWLETAITEIMTENMKTNPDAIFKLEEPESAFHAGPCSKPGYIVDRKYKDRFQIEVPLCQTCMRGFYLDRTRGICLACNQSNYASMRGMTSCRPCPSMQKKLKYLKGDSIRGCYDWASRTSIDAVNRGFIFIAAFHVMYVAILTLNIRRYIKVNLVSGRRDDHRRSN
ncbi:unnamed protein product [Candidula unifasciata]|uniref:Uncharacterized protein n=1 Tax=Candidula unifasciata TaxID=100452 RepID=A0A8S3YXR6_9EUPU|nr:unnamed protein product [Candidula unifasciata]